MTTKIVNEEKNITIRLRAFDHVVLDNAVASILKAVGKEALKSGPMPLPKKIAKYTINSSTNNNKTARDQYEIRSHSRIMVFAFSQAIVDSLMKFNLSSHVDVEIQLNNNK